MRVIHIIHGCTTPIIRGIILITTRITIRITATNMKGNIQ